MVLCQNKQERKLARKRKKGGEKMRKQANRKFPQAGDNAGVGGQYFCFDGNEITVLVPLTSNKSLV